MAHGWDSYFHDLPPISSDPQTLRRTSESEGSLSQHIENIAGQLDFPGTVDSCEDSATDPNLNTNYYSTPSIGNSSSDCIYQRYYKETSWQADSEQMDKDFLPRCSNGGSDFATDGLSASESLLPSSLPADLQELKQDCGMLASSFLEDYSDVSSCSDPDVNETRPSCKFMTSNSVPKPQPCINIKDGSSDWLFNQTENLAFPAEDQYLNSPESTAILSSSSNENARENMNDYAQDKMDNPENSVKTYSEYNQSSTPTNMVTTPMNQIVEDGDGYDACKDIKHKTMARALIEEYSNISISDHVNLENYPFDNDNQTTPETTADVLTVFSNQQKDFDDKLPPKETMKDSFNIENEVFDLMSSLDDQDRNMSEDKDNKFEILSGEIKQSASSENENSDKQQFQNSKFSVVPDETMNEVKPDKSQFLKGETKKLGNVNPDKHKSPNPNSINVQDENIREDAQQKSESLIGEMKESGSQKNSSNLDSSLVQDERMETTGMENEIHSNTSQFSDQATKKSDCEESTLKLGESINTLTSIRHDMQLCEHQSCNSQVEDNNCSPAVVKSTSDKNEGNVATNTASSFEPNEVNTDVNSCQEKQGISAEEKTNAVDIQKQEIVSLAEPCLQTPSSCKDINPCVEEDITSPEKNTISSPSDPDCSFPALTSDKEGQSAIESYLQSDISGTDINSNRENELKSPAQNTNMTSSPHRQPSQYHSSMAIELKTFSGGIAENASTSFEDSDTHTEEPSVDSVLFGEPLSREDSSCDTGETKLGSGHCKVTSLAIYDGNSRDCSDGQEIPFESSFKMRKYLQPVVILQTESKNGMTNYRCADCQHTTYNAQQLIEHYHSSHSIHNIQFCNTCDIYLARNEMAKKHICVITKESPQLSHDSSKQKEKFLGQDKCNQCGLRLPLMTNDQAENHVCSVINKGTRIPFDSTQLRKKKNGRHKCMICKVRFSKLYQYVAHMRIHTGKTPFLCCGCGTYFAQSSSLHRHISVPGRCKLSEHQPVIDSDAIISETEIRPQNNSTQNECAKLPECYIKLVDISKTHMCHYCGKGFLSAEEVKKHLCGVQPGKHLAVSLSRSTTEVMGKYKCPLCSCFFKNTYKRAQHLRDCVKEKVVGGKDKVAGKYRCPLCYTTFTLASNRYRHINTFCLRAYLNQLTKQDSKPSQKPEHNSLKENEETKQELQVVKVPKSVPKYRCSLCPAVFWNPSGIYRHRKKHELFKLTGKKIRYRHSDSSVMGKPPTLNSAETEESKDTSHSNEEITNHSLSCNYCGKSFSTSQSLKKHESDHKGEKPYHCLECGKGFKKHTHLIGHKGVHQRKIQCTVCKKILPSIRELLQHRRSHLKRGMLQCPDCHVQFQYPAHLIRHVNAHRKREIKALKREERSQLKLKLQQSLEILKEQSGAKQLQCSLCQEVFNDAHGLRKHCLTHISGPLSHQCPFCDRNFTNRRGLLRHMVRHTGDKAFSCTNCGKQFYRQIYLKLHIEQCLPAQNKHPVTSGQCLPAQNKHPVTVQLDKTPRKMGSHKCSYCPRLFSKKIRLKNHLNGHRKNTLLHCSRCNQYYGFTKLTSHQKNCNGPEVSDGLSVPKSSYDNSTSKMRPNIPKRDLQSSSTKILQFKCSYCTQRFRYRSLLLRHVVSHTGLQPYACVHCGHRFGSRTSCVTHEANCSDVNKEGESSVDASKQLSNMPTLRVVAQKLQTEGETEYKCKFCTKTFMKSRNLRRHILTHNEVKPYRCKACDNCFSRYDHLKVHQIRCKGRRSRLEVCIPKISLDDVGKGWQNKFNLNPTEKQETFECTICSRSFPTHAKLSRHNTLFHSTKLFKCAGCGASFSHEKSLKHHRKVKRCRKLSKETGEPSPLVTVLPEESVTKPLDRVRNQILQRIQPHYSKNYKYVCNYCPRAFGNGYQLRVHTRLHTGERPFACDYCGERFIRKDYVLRHYPKCIKKPHQKKVLCHRCGGFFHQIKLKSHKKSCMLASSSSKSTVDKSQPSSSQSPPKGFSCAYCSSRFLLFSQLQEHFLDEHKMETMFPPASTVPLQHHLSSIPNIKEEPVDKSCDKQPNLTYKMDTAVVGEVSKSFSCSVCNMRFLNKAGLTGHQRVHTKDPPFICKTCKRGFWNKFLLRNHQRKCRPESNPLSISTQKSDVPLKAKLDFALNDSVLVFNEGTKTIGTGVLQTNFSCKEDLSETPQNSEGNETQDISNKDKKAVQYQCSECEQSFTDGLMLISHLEDHGREEQEKKRNTCLKCGRVFSSQGFLEKHMKMHGINKKYSCPNCPEMFYMSSDLEAHMLCHDINRPYACKFCNERFWTRPALCNHYSEEHPDDVYHCRFCNKAYSVKKSLSRHYKKWHQQEQKEYSIAQEKKYADKQLSSQVSTTESYEDDNNDMEDSDSDCAPYFPCHVCGKTFPTSESLEDHQRCHLGEKPHECAECGRCFFQASQLQQHQRMHKSEFQCQACGRGFVSLFALRKHKHTHGKSRPYRCPRCDFSFTGPSQLAEHMSTHREENFPCDICNRIFLSKSSRAEHRKCHSKLGGHYSLSVSRKMHKESDSHPKVSAVNKELKYRCGVCSERFRDPEKLSEHGCMAAKERPYTCLDCDKHFLHASHLKKHTNIHGLSLPGGQYPCYQCNTTFSSAQQFLSHLKSHDFTNTEMNYQTKEGASTQRYTCPVCRQDFGSAAEMTEHFSMHSDSSFNCKMAFPSGSELEEHEHHHLTSTTQSECTDCGEKFLGSNNIHQHSCFLQRNRKMVNQHSNPLSKTAPTHQAAEEEDIDVTGEDLYYCPICSMQFSSKSKLLEHQNKHRNEKPFSCELCGKTFALRRYLKEHERRHWQKSVTQTTATLSEKKHKCTQCKAEFKTSQELSLHLRFHAEKEVGEFRCDMCYKSFSKWSYLKQHQESHVGQVVYECDECEKAFAFPHLLEEHQLSHAGSSR